MKRFIIFSLLVGICMLFTGCGNAQVNVANNLINDLNKLSNTIKSVNEISTSDIIISDLISEENIASSKQYSLDSAQVSGYAYNVPNYMRNTDTYGNGFLYNRYPFPYPNNFYGYGGYGNMYPYNNNYFYGNGIVGTNIDSYRENLANTVGNNYYQGVAYYPNQQWQVPVNYPQTKRPRFVRNVNTYKEVSNNIDTYKKANTYEERYNKTGTTNLENHYQKLNNLCAIQYDVLGCNEECNQAKTRILGAISYLKSIAEQIKNGNITLSESQMTSVKDLLNNINEFNSKINISKSDVYNELKYVKSLKTSYSANVDQLSSKYIRLLNSLDIRNSYYQNILSAMYQIENCIIGPQLNYPVTLPEYEDNLVENTKNTENCDTDCDKDCENCSMPQKIKHKIIEIEKNDDIVNIRRKTWEKDEQNNVNEENKEDSYIIKDGKLIPNIETNTHLTDNPDKIGPNKIEKLTDQIAGERKTKDFIPDRDATNNSDIKGVL